MGFSVSASTIIIFIALILSAGAVYTTYDYSQDQIMSAYQDEKTDFFGKKSTEIEITNTSYDSANNTYTLLLNNTGETTLLVKETSLLLDGKIQPEANYSIKSEAVTNYWLPGETLLVNATHDQEPSRAKVVSSNGVTEMVS